MKLYALPWQEVINSFGETRYVRENPNGHYIARVYRLQIKSGFGFSFEVGAIEYFNTFFNYTTAAEAMEECDKRLLIYDYVFIEEKHKALI